MRGEHLRVFACLITMVQGNVLALTASHWFVASETGLVGGVIAATTMIAAKFRQPRLISLTLGAVTVAADAIVHRATFGAASLMEAVITGVGALLLSLAVSRAAREVSTAVRPADPGSRRREAGE